MWALPPTPYHRRLCQQCQPPNPMPGLLQTCLSPPNRAFSSPAEAVPKHLPGSKPNLSGCGYNQHTSDVTSNHTGSKSGSVSVPVILANWPHIRPSAVQFPGLQRPRAQHCPFPSKSGPHMNFKGTKSQNPGGIWGLEPTTTALSPWERSKHPEPVCSFHSSSSAPNDLLGWVPGTRFLFQCQFYHVQELPCL